MQQRALRSIVFIHTYYLLSSLSSSKPKDREPSLRSQALGHWGRFKFPKGKSPANKNKYTRQSKEIKNT